MTETGSAESSYYTWVDQHNTFGLGKDVPMATGNNSNSLHALVDGKFIQLRVPYPMGFFAKGMDGRIDDPNAGWKGRGLWSTYRQPHALPPRRRQGHQAQGGEIPASARSAGALRRRRAFHFAL